MIRLVLFDIDGTLIRTGGAGVRAFERTFALEFGIPHATANVEFAGRTDTSLVRQCFRKHGLPDTPANFQRFFDVYYFMLEHLLEHTHGAACSGVLRFIEDLKGLPEPPLTGLLTGNVRLGAEIKLRRYDLWDHFVSGAFGDDHEDRNQLAAIAQQRGSQCLGEPLHGREILVVGDTPRDVECARAIQARMLAVGTGGYSCDELRLCSPDWVVPTLSELRAETVCLGPDCSKARARPAGRPAA